MNCFISLFGPCDIVCLNYLFSLSEELKLLALRFFCDPPVNLIFGLMDFEIRSFVIIVVWIVFLWVGFYWMIVSQLWFDGKLFKSREEFRSLLFAQQLENCQFGDVQKYCEENLIYRQHQKMAHQLATLPSHPNEISIHKKFNNI